MVKDITDKYTHVQIENKQVNIRSLVSKQQRVIFSNVSPDIPNYIFEDILDKLNVKRSSPVITLKATIAKEGDNHVASFRRQVFVNPSGARFILESFKIRFNEINYFIYASTAILKCFNCKLEGHLAKNCVNLSQSNLNPNNNSTIEDTIVEESDVARPKFTNITPEVNSLKSDNDNYNSRTNKHNSER